MIKLSLKGDKFWVGIEDGRGGRDSWNGDVRQVWKLNRRS